MKYGLNIRADGALDFVSLGALVHRLDPGIIPFRKASECQIHVSGGEFNVAANLADCFRMRTGVATAMVDYPIGDLIAERVKAMGVRPFYKRFEHNGVNGPNMAAVYSDRGQGERAPVVFYNRSNEAAARLKPGDFDWDAIFGAGVDCRGNAGGEGCRRSDLLRSELPGEALENFRQRGPRSGNRRAHRRKRRGPGRERRGPAEGAGRSRPGDRRGIEIKIETRPERLFRNDRSGHRAASADQDSRDDPARGPLDEPSQLGRGCVDQWGDARCSEPGTLRFQCRGWDGFASGFFYGLLTGTSPEEAVKLGWAHGALLTTFPGDTTMATVEQVRAFAEGGSARIQR